VPFERRRADGKVLRPPTFLEGDEDIGVVNGEEYGNALAVARKMVNAGGGEAEPAPAESAEGSAAVGSTAKMRTHEEMAEDENTGIIYVDEVFARAHKFVLHAQLCSLPADSCIGLEPASCQGATPSRFRKHSSLMSSSNGRILLSFISEMYRLSCSLIRRSLSESISPSLVKVFWSSEFGK
jgi:hypothetical protein